MKNFTKLLVLIGAAVCLNSGAQAQFTGTPNSNQAEVGPNNTVVGNGISTQALFDQQFNYDITATTGAAGNAGVVHLGSEFWVSKWASDTMWRLDNTGSLISFFNIATGAGGGIRSLTTDGTVVYAGQNAAEI